MKGSAKCPHPRLRLAGALRAWSAFVDRSSLELSGRALVLSRCLLQRHARSFAQLAGAVQAWRAAAARSWAIGKQLKLYDPALARRILESQDGTDAFIKQLEALGSL